MDSVVFTPHKTCFFDTVWGEVRPYNGNPLPHGLSKPLKLSDSPNHNVFRDRHGILIGSRSCVLNEDGIWYKIKGCDPIEEAYDEWQPRGAMSYSTAVNELNAAALIQSVLREYGLDAPHEPVGITKYRVKWGCGFPRLQRRAAYNAIMATRGEERVQGLNRLYSSGRIIEGRDMVESVCRSLAEWVGFSLRVLKEAKINLDIESIALGNVACYRTNGGYGFFLIDHEFSEIGHPLSRKSIARVKSKFREAMRVKINWQGAFETFFMGNGVPDTIPPYHVEYALGSVASS